MSDRERAMQLLDAVPDYKIGYVVAYLQGVTAGEDEPNTETIAAFEERMTVLEKIKSFFSRFKDVSNGKL